jgi:hypothetical protein
MEWYHHEKQREKIGFIHPPQLQKNCLDFVNPILQYGGSAGS